MLWLLRVVTDGWVNFAGIALCAILWMVGLLTSFGAYDPEGRTTRRSVVVGVILMVVGVVGGAGLLIVTQSESGRWAALDSESPIEDYVSFLQEFPQSQHRPEIEKWTRDAQDRLLETLEGEGLRSVLLRAMRTQPLPPELSFQVIAKRGVLKRLTADRQRYHTALDRFEQEVQKLFEGQFAEFAPVVVRREFVQAVPAVVTVVLHYEVHCGHRYIQQPSGYRFDAIELQAHWGAYVPGAEKPVVAWKAPRTHAPSSPHWEGSKHPEGVIADIVIGKVLAKIAEQVASS